MYKGVRQQSTKDVNSTAIRRFTFLPSLTLVVKHAIATATVIVKRVSGDRVVQVYISALSMRFICLP